MAHLLHGVCDPDAEGIRSDAGDLFPEGFDARAAQVEVAAVDAVQCNQCCQSQCNAMQSMMQTMQYNQCNAMQYLQRSKSQPSMQRLRVAVFVPLCRRQMLHTHSRNGPSSNGKPWHPVMTHRRVGRVQRCVWEMRRHVGLPCGRKQRNQQGGVITHDGGTPSPLQAPTTCPMAGYFGMHSTRVAMQKTA